MTENDPKDTSRRGFLRTATGALLASPLLARPAEAQVPNIPLPELPGEKVGWAIVGLGSLAIHQILPALPKCGRSRLAALVSGRPEKAKHLARYYGLAEKNVYTYETFDRIAQDPSIGAVYVVLPNSMHEEYTVRALKANPPKSGKAFITINVTSKAKGVTVDVGKDGSTFTITGSKDVEAVGWDGNIQKAFKRVSSKS